MKAWEELKNNEDVTLCKTSNSEWYINHGVKIERFINGKVEVKNTMTNSDHYENISKDLMDVFIYQGWQAGAFCVCIDVYKKRVDVYNRLIRRAVINKKYEVADRLKESREKVINKFDDYVGRLEKLLPSLHPLNGDGEIKSPITQLN